MRRRRSRDPGLPTVRNDWKIFFSGQISDAQRFGQPPYASDIRLYDRNPSPGYQVGKFEPGGQPFAHRDRNIDQFRQLGVFVQIVAPDRGFNEVEIEFFPLLYDWRSGCRIGKHVLDINHQRYIASYRFSNLSDQFGMAFIWFPHSVMRIRPVHRDFGFHRPEPQTFGAFRRRAKRVAIVVKAMPMRL